MSLSSASTPGAGGLLPPEPPWREAGVGTHLEAAGFSSGSNGARPARTRSIAWRVLVVLALVLAAMTGWRLARRPDSERVARPEAYFGRSSLHTGAFGTKAFYLLLEALEVPVSRRMEPLELFSPDGLPLVVMAAPDEAFSPSELRWLSQYVASGGSALIAPYAAREGEIQPPPVGLELINALDLELVFASSPDTLEGESQNPHEALVPVTGLAIVAGLTPTELRSGALAPGALAPGERAPGEMGAAAPVGEAREPAGTLVGASASGAPSSRSPSELDGVSRIVVRGGARLQWSTAQPVGAVVLAEDDAGIAAVAVPWGAGTFLVFSDLYPMTNRGLSRYDNAAFLTSIVDTYAGSGGALFDEYHHGVQSDRSVLSLLAGTPLGWCVLQLGLIAAVWLYAGAVRFGPPLPMSSGGRRRGQEQVEALANLFERTRARQLAAGMIWDHFFRQARRLLGLPPGIDPPNDQAELARVMAVRLQLEPEFLPRLARDTQRPDLSGAELVRLDRHLNTLLRRLEHDARTGSPSGAHPVS